MKQTLIFSFQIQLLNQMRKQQVTNKERQVINYHLKQILEDEIQMLINILQVKLKIPKTDKPLFNFSFKSNLANIIANMWL